MGFGSALSTYFFMMFFFVIIGGIFVSYMGNLATQADSLLDLQGNLIAVQEVSLRMINVSNYTGATLAQVKNTGRKGIEVEDIDVYVDGRLLLRNATDRNITILDDTNNPGIFNPGESLEINITQFPKNGTQVRVTHTSGAITNGTLPFYFNESQWGNWSVKT